MQRQCHDTNKKISSFHIPASALRFRLSIALASPGASKGRDDEDEVTASLLHWFFLILVQPPASMAQTGRNLCSMSPRRPYSLPLITYLIIHLLMQIMITCPLVVGQGWADQDSYDDMMNDVSTFRSAGRDQCHILLHCYRYPGVGEWWKGTS